MDMNRDRPVHGLDLLNADDTTAAPTEGHLPHFGGEQREVIENNAALAASEGYDDWERRMGEQLHPTPFQIALAVAQFEVLASASFGLLDRRSIMEVVNKMVDDLELKSLEALASLGYPLAVESESGPLLGTNRIQSFVANFSHSRKLYRILRSP